jgi:hypothetical protein
MVIGINKKVCAIITRLFADAIGAGLEYYRNNPIKFATLLGAFAGLTINAFSNVVIFILAETHHVRKSNPRYQSN